MMKSNSKTRTHELTGDDLCAVVPRDPGDGLAAAGLAQQPEVGALVEGTHYRLVGHVDVLAVGQGDVEVLGLSCKIRTRRVSPEELGLMGLSLLAVRSVEG